jgi:hypothetical protein
MSGNRRKPFRQAHPADQGGYWLALLVIAAMVMASFILLQQMMAATAQRYLLNIVGTQKCYRSVSSSCRCNGSLRATGSRPW